MGEKIHNAEMVMNWDIPNRVWTWFVGDFYDRRRASGSSQDFFFAHKDMLEAFEKIYGHTILRGIDL